LTGEANDPAESVKVSFFGNISFGRVELTEDGVLEVASLDDLMAAKVKVLLPRVEAKDYKDIAAMLKAGVSLASALAAARRMYSPAFQPSESLKALTYFEGGDLQEVSSPERETLIQAVRKVGKLPVVSILDRKLSALLD
jgi:hypothetical protein